MPWPQSEQALTKHRTQNLHLSQPVQCSTSNMAMKVLIAVANIYCCGSSCFIVLVTAVVVVVVVVVGGGGGGEGGVTYH